MRVLAGLVLAAAAFGQQAELAAIVDAARPAVAAREFADRTPLDLAQLLEAMRAFGHDGGARTGTWAESARLAGKPAEITVYVPEGYAPTRPAPLMLALHGAGGEGAQALHDWTGVADQLGMVVVAPTEAGANEGYAWTANERAQVLAALRWSRRRFNIDENRVHLSGVSRGGHLTWDVALRHPDRWASLAPMIGGPRLDIRAGQNNLRFLGNVAHVPIRDLQGEKDHPLLLFNLRLAFAKLEKLGARDAELHVFPGLGHGYRFAAVDWVAFLRSAVRDPRRARVVRLAVHEGEGRSGWVEILKVKHGMRASFQPRVRAAEWNTLDDGGRRRFLVAEAEKRTARLEVEMRAPGTFVAKSSGVQKFRLLLAEGMFTPGEPVTVTWNGRSRKKTPRPSKRLLLEDFAARFDRTYLPVAEVRIP